MKRLRKLPVVLVVAILVSACATPQQRAPSGTPVSEAVAASRLVPQPEGTPLPPRDPHIADHWPPEFKQMIDNLLSLYPREGKPPSVQEVEKKMGITLTERPRGEFSYGIYKHYGVSGTRYADVALEKWGGGLAASYYIFRHEPPQGMTQSLNLVTSVPQSGFCLDPYELAIYTGSKFVNGDTSPHAAPRIWQPAYVWGMFEWSETSRYIGESFYIVIGQRRDATTRKVLGAGCVAAISVSGRYIKE